MPTVWGGMTGSATFRREIDKPLVKENKKVKANSELPESIYFAQKNNNEEIDITVKMQPDDSAGKIKVELFCKEFTNAKTFVEIDSDEESIDEDCTIPELPERPRGMMDSVMLHINTWMGVKPPESLKLIPCPRVSTPSSPARKYTFDKDELNEMLSQASNLLDFESRGDEEEINEQQVLKPSADKAFRRRAIHFSTENLTDLQKQLDNIIII